MNVIPGQHILGLMGLQEAVASKMAEDSGPDGVLEALEELGCESRGFVEAEMGGGILARITLDPLEDGLAAAPLP